MIDRDNLGEWDMGIDEGMHDAYLEIWIRVTDGIARRTSYGFKDVLTHAANAALGLSRDSDNAAERRWCAKLVKELRKLADGAPQ